MIKPLILATILVGTAAVVPSASAAAEIKQVSGYVRVIDGDTIVIGATTIRLKGVDAPELQAPGGLAAKIALERIIDGQLIACQLTGEKTYGREVGYCREIEVGPVPPEKEIGGQLIASGAALACPFFSERYLHLERVSFQPRSRYCHGWRRR